MTELLVIFGLILAIFVLAFLFGKSSEKEAVSKKAATVAKKQAKIAAKPRKRDAKSVADDISKHGL